MAKWWRRFWRALRSVARRAMATGRWPVDVKARIVRRVFSPVRGLLMSRGRPRSPPRNQLFRVAAVWRARVCLFWPADRWNSISC